jgi:hypothetical protein
MLHPVVVLHRQELASIRDPIFEVRRCGWKRHDCAAACDRVAEPELDVEFFYEPLMLTEIHQPSFA